MPVRFHEVQKNLYIETFPFSKGENLTVPLTGVIRVFVVYLVVAWGSNRGPVETGHSFRENHFGLRISWNPWKFKLPRPPLQGLGVNGL